MRRAAERRDQPAQRREIVGEIMPANRPITRTVMLGGLAAQADVVRAPSEAHAMRRGEPTAETQARTIDAQVTCARAPMLRLRSLSAGSYAAR